MKFQVVDGRKVLGTFTTREEAIKFYKQNNLSRNKNVFIRERQLANKGD